MSAYLTLTLVCFLQSKEAEEALKRIEEKLEKASTLTMKFAYTERGDAASTKGQGTLLMKEGNKVSLSLTLEDNAEKFDLRMLSDGSTLSLPLADAPDLRTVPKNLKQIMLKAVVRAGIAESWYPIRRATAAGSPEEVDAALNKLFVVSEITFGDDEGGTTKTLLYKIEETAFEPAYSAKLWYDPKTNMLIKRTLERAGQKGRIRSTESYEAINLNEEIPEDKFKLRVRK
jgi:outer membrane lipoprotein-sorting protein